MGLKSARGHAKPVHRHAHFAFILLGILPLSTGLWVSCDKGGKPSEEAVEWVAAHSSGEVSSVAPIRIRFAREVGPVSGLHEPLAQNPFSFKPGLDGKAFWVSATELHFKPAKRLPPEESYQGRLHWSKLAMNLPEGAPTPPKGAFEFAFQVRPQQMDITAEPPQTLGGEAGRQGLMRFEGLVRTSDPADGGLVEAAMKAELDGKAVALKWYHSPGNVEHRFSLDSLARAEGARTILLKWDGKPIGAAQDGKREYSIPGLSDFKVQDVRVDQENRSFTIHFSDPLQKDQNLSGLIRTGQLPGVRFAIEGNQVVGHAQNSYQGEFELVVENVKNFASRPMGERFSRKLRFEDLKPKVRFAAQGSILPEGGSLSLPIEVMNLSGVDVEVMRVYGDNMLQFLQRNSLAGESDLKSVGRVLWRKSFDLNAGPRAYNRWKAFALDLGDLVGKEKGALYRVTVGARKGQSLYPCPDGGEDSDALSKNLGNWDSWGGGDETSGWDGIEDYYTPWEDRQDPCKNAYYSESQNRSATNVFVSNLGLIAKRNQDEGLQVAVTDLRSAEPVSGAKVTAYNYQGVAIASGETDGRGFTQLAPRSRAFVLKAEADAGLAYLKVDDGSALSIGHFPVGGATVSKGLRGFLYGERGVWRPGDSLHVFFALDDTENPLPAGHPVSFDLKDARGQQVLREVRHQGVGGFYRFSVPTLEDAPTGMWRAEVVAGGARFEKALRVETVKPNRLKVSLDLGKGPLTVESIPLQGRLESRWLHGAPTGPYKAKVEVALRSTQLGFQEFPDYRFIDLARDPIDWKHEIWEGSLDSDGNKSLKLDFTPPGEVPGRLDATFLTRVFEPGGDGNVNAQTLPFHAHDVYIGLRAPQGDRARGMLLTDTGHVLELVTVDPSGKPTGDRRLDVSLYKIDWRWWWDKSDESLAQVVTGSSHKPIHQGEAQLRKGRGTWRFEVKYPDWGRYLLRACDAEVKDGHCAGQIVFIDWPGWAGKGRGGTGDVGATLLSLEADKEAYATGEKAVITLPSSPGAKVLVSVESGAKVLDSRWVNCEGDRTRIEVPLDARMVPGAYLHAMLIQPYPAAGKKKNDEPLRLYGVLPLKVEDPRARLQPQVRSAAAWRPLEQAEITVTEAKGRPMAYTLAVVDEGLLDLTNFKTPDIWDGFNQKPALGVKTFDLYNEVLGAFGGVLEGRIAIGGDGDLSASKEKTKGKRFPPMVRVLGPFELAKGKSAKHVIDVPNYVGSVRIMVVAGELGADDAPSAWGHAETTAFVKKPLMILTSLPRVLGLEETVQAVTTLFAMEDGKHKVTYAVEAGPGLEVMPKDSDKGRSRSCLGLKQAGVCEEITVQGPSEQLVGFTLKSQNTTGWSHVVLRAKMGREDVEERIEIPLRTAQQPETRTVTAQLAAGSDWTGAVAPFGLVGTRHAGLELSLLPPIDLGERLSHLVRFPYGCLEQTTSTAFPQLHLSALAQLPKEWDKKIQDHIKGGIQRLRQFQNADGSFSYWPGGYSRNDYSSLYAGHFLIEAKAKGYDLPYNMLESFKSSLRSEAVAWTEGDAESRRLQAYRLYLLALSGEPDLAGMNRLRLSPDLPTPSRFRLAAAYGHAGQAGAARDVAQGPMRAGLFSGREMGGTFGSPLRDQAVMLECYTVLGRSGEAEEYANNIAKRLGDNAWLSTQEIGYSLTALSKYAGAHFASGDAWKADWRLGSNKGDLGAKTALARVDLPWNGETGELRVANRSQRTLHARILVEALPEQGEETDLSQGLGLDLQYENLKGEAIEIEQLPQGTDFRARITVRAVSGPTHFSQLALSAIFPSGWEVRNPRIEEGATLPLGVTYQDIRDDRVYSFFDLQREKELTVTIPLHAAWVGRYYHPSVEVSAMYDDRYKARHRGRWVEVIVPGMEN